MGVKYTQYLGLFYRLYLYAHVTRAADVISGENVKTVAG